MTNFPPEHRNPSPDDDPAPEEATGSFPAVNQEFMPPAAPSADELGTYNNAHPPAPHVGQFQPPPAAPVSTDSTSTGQFPAFRGQEPQAPKVESGGPFNQPVTYETNQVPRIGPQSSPGLAPESLEQKHSTMQIGVDMPDAPVEPAGPATGVADAVELLPVPNPNIGIADDHAAVSEFDESDIDGYIDTDDIDADLPARVQKKLAKKAQPDSKLQQLRNERDSDSGWSYLAILGILFFLLIGFAWGCQRVADGDQSAARNAQLATEVNVTVRVGGDQVGIVGALPDEETANALYELITQHYESDLVTNALTVNSAISIDDSVLEITGQAEPGDTRPEELEATLKSQFAVLVASNNVQFGALPENLVAVSAQVSGSSVVLTGSVPDQTKLDLVVGSAESAWGADNVDASALVIDEVIWSGGRVSVAGDIPLGSSEPQQFADGIQVEGIFVESGTADNDIATASPDELKAAIGKRFETTPISFEVGKQALTDEDEVVLDGIAELLLALPEEENIVIIGYSDTGGEAAADRELAAQRARIAWAYLTQKKGVTDSVDNEGSAANSTSKITIDFR